MLLASCTSSAGRKDVRQFLLWVSTVLSVHTHPALIRTLAQNWWNGANIDSIWAIQITPPSADLSLLLSFTLSLFPSNLPLPLSLTFPFIPFLRLPFFSPPLCPRLSPRLSLPPEASQAVSAVRSGHPSSSRTQFNLQLSLFLASLDFHTVDMKTCHLSALLSPTSCCCLKRGKIIFHPFDPQTWTGKVSRGLRRYVPTHLHVMFIWAAAGFCRVQKAFTISSFDLLSKFHLFLSALNYGSCSWIKLRQPGQQGLRISTFKPKILIPRRKTGPLQNYLEPKYFTRRGTSKLMHWQDGAGREKPPNLLNKLLVSSLPEIVPKHKTVGINVLRMTKTF